MPMGIFAKSTKKLGYYSLIALCLIQCSASSLLADDAPSDHKFEEVVLKPIPETEPVEDSEDCDCEKKSKIDPVSYQIDPVSYEEPVYELQFEVEDRPAYYTGVFGGMSHFDTDAENALGGQFGAYVAKPLTNAVSLFGMVNLNSFTGGTQYGGTVGLMKIGVPSRYHSDRIGGSIMFDQFTDTTVGSPYIANFRYDLNYSINSTVKAGTRYSHTINGGTVRAVVPGGGGVPLQSFDLVEGYLQGYVYGINGQFGVGWVDVIDAVSYRLSGTQDINESLSLNTYLNYYNNGNWNSYVGLSLALGSKRAGCDSCVAKNSGTGDIVRGQFRANDTVTLGDLQRAMNAAVVNERLPEDDTFRQRVSLRAQNLIRQMILEFGEDAIVPPELANQIVAQSIVFRNVAQTGPGNSQSSEGSALVGPLRELRQILLEQGNEIKRASQFAVLNTLQQQAAITNFVNYTANGGNMGGNGCPPNYPFRIFSGGMCFCCDNAMGTGVCITCP